MHATCRRAIPHARTLGACFALMLCLALVGALGALGPPARAAEVPGPGPTPAGAWTWPLVPTPPVARAFEAPLGPYGPGHRGVDLSGTVGQPVLAVAAGRVSFAGQVAGRGVVVVDHGRLRTTYEPVLTSVRADQQVGQGAVVGTVTLAGGHCLPRVCLHLGAREGDTYVDPLTMLSSGRVRLLPLTVTASDPALPTGLLLPTEPVLQVPPPWSWS